MIFVAGLAAATISVGLVGDVSATDLSKWLGSSYTISQYTSLSQAAAAQSRIILINRVPAANRWSSDRDGFVSSFEADLDRLKSKSPRSRIFVLLPSAGQNGFSEETYASEVIPLVRQAAVETGTDTIEVKDQKSWAEDISDAIFDFAAQKATWKLVSADSEEPEEGPAANAIDGKLDTYWHTQYSPTSMPYPHQITVDMGSQASIAGFRYVPRQDGGTNGRVKKFEFFLSLDGNSWGDAVISGMLPNTTRPIAIHFPSPKTGRYFKFVALSEQSGGPWASAAEIDVLPAP